MKRLGINERQARCLAGDLAEFGRALMSRQDAIVKDWREHQDGDPRKADAGDYLIAQCEKLIAEMEIIANGNSERRTPHDRAKPVDV